MRKIAGYLTKNRSGKDQKIAQSTHENEYIKPRKTFWRNSKQLLNRCWFIVMAVHFSACLFLRFCIYAQAHFLTGTCHWCVIGSWHHMSTSQHIRFFTEVLIWCPIDRLSHDSTPLRQQTCASIRQRSGVSVRPWRLAFPDVCLRSYPFLQIVGSSFLCAKEKVFLQTCIVLEFGGSLWQQVVGSGFVLITFSRA